MPPVIEPIPTLIDMRYKYTSLPSSFAEFFTETVTERIGSMKHFARSLPPLLSTSSQSPASAQRTVDHE
jgi:hypothetical protein